MKTTHIDTIVAALPHLPEQVADMIVLQMLTGLTPSEVCHLTAKRAKKLPLGKMPLDELAPAFIDKYLPGKGKEKHLFCNLHRNRDKPMSTGTYSRIIADAIKKHGLVKFTPGKIKIDREQIETYIDRSCNHPFIPTKKDKTVTDLRDKIVGSMGRLSYYVLKLQGDIERYYEFLDRSYEATKFDDDGLPAPETLKAIGYNGLVELATKIADGRALPLIVDCIPGKWAIHC